MVIWFFENVQFTDAWIPFDRANQKKLEYVYRHHEELINFLTQQQQQHQQHGIDELPIDDSLHHKAQLKDQQQQQQLKSQHNEQPIDSIIEEKQGNHLLPAVNTINEDEAEKIDNESLQKIENIDLEEEDASIHQNIQYAHNCIYINLLDSHFEQEITLYPAMLLGSLPDRDILIIRAAEMMENSHDNKYLDII